MREQAFLVCKSIAQACADLVARPGVVIDLGYAHKRRHAQLFSPLILAWAQRMPHLSLDRSICKIPGLEAFLAGAQQLSTVTLHDMSHGHTNHCLRFLKGHPTVTKLTFEECSVPGHFPAALQELHVSSCAHIEAEFLLSSLIKRGVHLRVFMLGTIPASQFFLPPLDELNISIDLSRESSHLPALFTVEWLQKQPCKQLNLTCVVDDTTLRDPQPFAAVQRLQIHHLRVHLPSGFSERLQKALQPLGKCRTVSLLIHTRARQVILRMLPACSHLHIRIPQCHDLRVIIDWAALASQACCVSMHLGFQGKWCRVEVRGFPGCLPFDDAGKTWQFVVLGQGKVHGLPTSQLRDISTYLLQNEAATAAGWTDGPVQPWCLPQ